MLLYSVTVSRGCGWQAIRVLCVDLFSCFLPHITTLYQLPPSNGVVMMMNWGGRSRHTSVLVWWDWETSHQMGWSRYILQCMTRVYTRGLWQLSMDTASKHQKTEIWTYGSCS